MNGFVTGECDEFGMTHARIQVDDNVDSFNAGQSKQHGESCAAMDQPGIQVVMLEMCNGVWTWHNSIELTGDRVHGAVD